jgi:hypothetical protein
MSAQRRVDWVRGVEMLQALEAARGLAVEYGKQSPCVAELHRLEHVAVDRMLAWGRRVLEAEEELRELTDGRKVVKLPRILGGI